MQVVSGGPGGAALGHGRSAVAVQARGGGGAGREPRQAMIPSIALSFRAAASPGGRRVIRIVVTGLAVQLSFGIVFAWGAVVPLVRASDHWPNILLGAVFSATPAGYGLGTAAGGRLADRLPPRRLCWAALGLLAVGFAVALAAPSGLTFVLFYAFVALGLGGGLALTGAVGALASAMPGRAGAAGGLAGAAYAASAMVLAPVIGALAPRLGWLGALRAVGTAALVVSAVLVALMPDLPPGERRAGRAGRLAGSPAVRGGFLLALCGATFGSFAAVDLAGEVAARHLGAGLATAAVSIFAGGNAASRLAAGLTTDRLGTGPVLAAVFALELAAAAILFSGVGPITALVAAAAAGGALGGDAGSLSRVGADAAPDRPNSAFGLVFAGYTLGAFLGPIVGALVTTPAAWLVTATPAALGLTSLGALAAGRLSSRPP